MEHNWVEFYDAEIARTYIFPGGNELTIKNVKRICIRPSGNHRLETKDGEKYVVSAGWIAIYVESERWMF